MQYPHTSDSSDVPAPAPGYVTSDESSQPERLDGQCRASSVLGHRCPRPADVTFRRPSVPGAPYCLLHVFAYLATAVEIGLDDTLTVGPLS